MSFSSGDNPFAKPFTLLKENNISLNIGAPSDPEKEKKEKKPAAGADKSGVKIDQNSPDANGDGTVDAQDDLNGDGVVDAKDLKIAELQKDLQIRQMEKEIEELDDPALEPETIVAQRLRIKDRGDCFCCVDQRGNEVKKFPYDNKEVMSRDARYEAQRYVEKDYDNQITAKHSQMSDTAAATEKDAEEEDGLEEAVAQIDELKKSTLGSYVKKAAADQIGNTAKVLAGKNDPETERARRRMGQRMSGIAKATDKLTKEEAEQIDELKKSTLGSYVKKASSDMANNAYSLGARDPLKKPGSWNKAFKRKAGIEKATDRLAKEEVELDEGLYHVEYGRGGKLTHQVIAKDAKDAHQKAMAHLKKKNPKLAHPDYADTFNKPSITHVKGNEPRADKYKTEAARLQIVREDTLERLASKDNTVRAQVREFIELKLDLDDEQILECINLIMDGEFLTEAGYCDQPRTRAEWLKRLPGLEKKMKDENPKLAVRVSVTEETLLEIAAGKLDAKTIKMLKTLDADEARIIVQGLPKGIRSVMMKELGLTEKVDGRTTAYKETANRLLSKKTLGEAKDEKEEKEEAPADEAGEKAALAALEAAKAKLKTKYGYSDEDLGSAPAKGGDKEEAPAKGKEEAPAKGKEEAPAKGKEEAPAKADAKKEAPPAKGKEEAPAKDKAPAPAVKDKKGDGVEDLDGDGANDEHEVDHAEDDATVADLEARVAALEAEEADESDEEPEIRPGTDANGSNIFDVVHAGKTVASNFKSQGEAQTWISRNIELLQSGQEDEIDDDQDGIADKDDADATDGAGVKKEKKPVAPVKEETMADVWKNWIAARKGK